MTLASPKEKLVMLVDDDASILDLVDHVVKKEGFKSERAEDGEEGLKKILARKPDLVVLDIMMPGRGGFHLIKELQKSAETKDIPVLIVTGRYNDPETADMIRNEHNVRGYVQKPVKPASLIKLIHTMLGTRSENTDKPIERPKGFGRSNGKS